MVVFWRGSVPEKEKKKAKTPVQEEVDIQEYKSGDTKCEKCDKDFPTSTQLQRHPDKYFWYLYSFMCGATKQGLKEHAYTCRKRRRRQCYVSVSKLWKKI